MANIAEIKREWLAN